MSENNENIEVEDEGFKIEYENNIYSKTSGGDREKFIGLYSNSPTLPRKDIPSTFLDYSGSGSYRFTSEEEYFLDFYFEDYLYLDAIKHVYSSSDIFSDELEVYGFRLGKMEKISETLYNHKESEVIDITVKDKSFNKIRLLFRNSSEKTRAMIRTFTFINAVDTKSCFYYSENNNVYYNLKDGKLSPIRISQTLEEQPNGISDVSKIDDFELLSEMKKYEVNRIIEAEDDAVAYSNRNNHGVLPFDKNIIWKSLHVYRKPYIIKTFLDVDKSLDFFKISSNNTNLYHNAIFEVNSTLYGMDNMGMIKRIKEESEEDLLKYSIPLAELEHISRTVFEKITNGTFDMKVHLVYVANAEVTSNTHPNSLRSDFFYNNTHAYAILNDLKAQNTLPEAVIKEDKNDFYITIQDDNSDYVFSKIYINNELYYPANDSFDKSFKEFKKELKLDSTHLKVGKMNAIKVVFEDSWGEEREETYKFTYNYRGLMFIDPEDNKFYSDELGKILKRLQAGLVLSGKTSEVFKIKLRNTNKFDVVNPTLSFMIPEDMPKKKKKLMEGLGIEFSKTETPFAEKQYSLSWNNQILREGSEVDFFIRVFAEKDSEAVKDGELDILVNAIDIDYYKGDKKKLKYIV